MARVFKHEVYNPSRILADSYNRDEYDFIFSQKCNEAESSIGLFSKSLRDIATGFTELFSGTEKADASKLGEIHRVGTQYAAGFQAFLGITKMISGDVYSGVYNSLLGALGVSCSREGKSKDMLKTYVVITFINGCVQVMEVAQASLSGMPLLGHGLPILAKIGHLTSLLNPCASFIGAYLGWQFIKATKQQYMLALAHYQLQLLMMHQQQQMMQATEMQKDFSGAIDLKRLPPIVEDEEEGEVPEATGGSENRNQCQTHTDGSRRDITV